MATAIHTSKINFLDKLSSKFSVPVNELHAEMKRREKRYPAKHDNFHLDQVKEWRVTVVDWIVEVGDYLGLGDLTVHLAIALLDRLLFQFDIPQGRLQLVATSCILLAAKLEEREEYVPTVTDLNECTNDTYTPELIVKMESLILNQLEWDLNTITSFHFLGLYSEIVNDESDNKSSAFLEYSEFLINYCRLDYQFLQYLPSKIAAAAMIVARRVLHYEEVWPLELAQFSGYLASDLSALADRIWREHEHKLLQVLSGA